MGYLISSTHTIENILNSIDLNSIQNYTIKINEIGAATKVVAPILMRDFLTAHDITAFALAKTVEADLKSKAILESAESIAYLEKSVPYLKEHEIKDTSEARKQYVCIDPDVLIASDLKARCEALLQLLKNKLSQFRMAHDDIKKISYGDYGPDSGTF